MKVTSVVVCTGLHRWTQMWRIWQTYHYLHQAHHSHDICIFTRPVIAHFSIYYYFIWNIFVLFKAIHLMNKSGIIGIWLISWIRTLFDHSREEYDYLHFSKLYLMGRRGGEGQKMAILFSNPFTVWLQIKTTQQYQRFRWKKFERKPRVIAPFRWIFFKSSLSPGHLSTYFKCLLLVEGFFFLGSISHLKQLEILE